jgi:hypothetical protein
MHCVHPQKCAAGDLPRCWPRFGVTAPGVRRCAPTRLRRTAGEALSTHVHAFPFFQALPVLFCARFDYKYAYKSFKTRRHIFPGLHLEIVENRIVVLVAGGLNL